MSRSNDTATNTPLAIPRKLLERYLEEAAETVARRQEILGERIREARDAKGMKQKELAAQIHVESQTISNWERGKNTPDLDKLELLGTALGRPVSYFLTEPSENGALPTPLDEAVAQVAAAAALIAAESEKIAASTARLEELLSEQGPRQEPASH